MKKLSKNQIKAIQDKISALVKAMSHSSLEILKYFHYLLKNDAHKVMGCNKKGLIKDIKCSVKSESYLYRILNQASLEIELGLKANTIIESWAREITLNFKDAESREQVWEKAIELAGGKSKVRMPEVKEAITFIKSKNTPDAINKNDKILINEICQHIKNVSENNQSIDTFVLHDVLECNKETRELLSKILSLHLPNEKEHQKLTKEVRKTLGIEQVNSNKVSSYKHPDLRAVG